MIDENHFIVGEWCKIPEYAGEICNIMCKVKLKTKRREFVKSEGLTIAVANDEVSRSDEYKSKILNLKKKSFKESLEKQKGAKIGIDDIIEDIETIAI